MANAAAEPNAVADAAPPAKSSVKSALAQLLLVTLLAGGGGAAFETLRPPDKPAADKSVGSPSAAPLGATLVDLPPIVTNLAAPQDTWIRLEGSVVLDATGTPHPDVVVGEIAADLLAYLRTLTLRDVEGPIGLQNVRQDLSDRAAIRSGGKASELLIRTLVVQ